MVSERQSKEALQALLALAAPGFMWAIWMNETKIRDDGMRTERKMRKS